MPAGAMPEKAVSVWVQSLANAAPEREVKRKRGGKGQR